MFHSPLRRLNLGKKELEYAVAIRSGIPPVSLRRQNYQDISHFNLNAKVSLTAFPELC